MSTAPAPQTDGSERPLRGFAKSVVDDVATRTNATIAALLALAGITGLSGGFEEAEPEGIVTVAQPVGVNVSSTPITLEIEPFAIEIRRTYIVDGARVVEMRLTNTSSRPISWSKYTTAFTLEASWLPEEQQPRFMRTTQRLIDGQPITTIAPTTLTALNPGVPVDMAMIFADSYEDPTAAVKAEEADSLVVWSLKYKKSILDGSTTWLTEDRSAEVSLA